MQLQPRTVRLGMVGGGAGSNIGETHRYAARFDQRYALYSGYPMIRQARAMVCSGELGAIWLVQVEHASGWAATLLEAEGHKRALWRIDPNIAGKSSVVSDLGTHTHHLARFVTGLEIAQVSAELSSMVPGRKADDNGHLKLRFSNGARGLMWVSMVATGHLHGLRFRVHGERGSLEWVQEQPEQLLFRPLDGPQQILARGASGLAPEARRDGVAAEPLAALFPTVEDGVLGVKFVDAAVESNQRDGAWVAATLDLP